MAFDVQGALGAGYTSKEVADYLGQQKQFDVFGARQAGYSDDDIIKHLSAGPERSVIREVLDVPIGIAKGAVSGVGMLANLMGADTGTAKTIKGAEEYLNSLMSAQARDDQQEIARIMKEAEGKGMGEEVKAAVRAFSTAPVDMLSQALGTAAPAIAAALSAKILGVGALGTAIVGGATGAGMGAGVVKGTIYDETKRALLEAGMSEKQAEARAALAQEYGGKNLDMILGGAALGGIAATTGIEKALIGPLSRRILGQAAAKEAGEEAAKGIVRRVGTAAAVEAAPEFAQAAQEQLAANLAARREGLERDLMSGVVGAGTLEALAGAGLGAGIDVATGRPTPVPKEPTREEPRGEPKVTTYRVVDVATGQPVNVQVTQDPETGEITSVGPDGEPVDLTPFMRGDKTLEDALKEVYSDEEAETPTVVTEAAPEPKPEAPPPEIPTIAKAPAAPPAQPPAVTPPVTPPIEAPKAEIPEAPAPEAPKVEPIPKAEEPKVEEPKVEEPAPEAPQLRKREIAGTPVQIKKAENFAKKELGEVVYQDGDLFMYRRYNPKNGAVEYPVRLGAKQIAKDVMYYRGTDIDTQKQIDLSNVRREMEAESRELEKTQPFMKFDNKGLGMSEDIDPRVKGIVSSWKDMLGIDGNVYIATDDFVNKNYNRFVGDERNIVGMVRKESRGGATQQLRNGNRIIFYRKTDKINQILETIAHEMGHIHEAQTYQKADAATKKALRDAHAEWVKKTTGKTIAEFLPMLRAKASAKKTLAGITSPEKIPAERLNASYWKSFSEWYADQVARWAVSQEKPVGVVEQFFARLGKAMRAFYQQLKNAGYLPNETFVQYLNNVTKNVNIAPLEVEAGPIEEMAEPEIEKPKDGMVRLYRAESNPDAPKKSPAQWIQESEEYKRSLQAEGRWFTDRLDEATWYLENEYPNGRLTYIDVPANQVESFRVLNIPEKIGGKQVAESPRAFSRKPEVEFFVPSEMAAKRQPLRISKPLEIMEMAEPEVKKLPKGRSPELAEAAQKVARGEMSAKEYDEMVKKVAPIPVFKDVKSPNTKEELAGALNVTQREKIGPTISEGTTVGLRLDINASRKGVPAITIHESRGENPYSSKTGKVIGYDSVAKIRDVFFAPGKPETSLEIAKGKEKEPLGTAEGRWINITPEQAVKEAEEALKSSDWVQVGMDPTRHSYFYDRKTTEPVLFADEVIQIGNQMFAKNAQYGNKDEFLYMETGKDEDIGKSAVETIKRLGREAKPDPTRLEKIKEIFTDDQGNVKLTSPEAKAQAKRFLDRVETWAFSTDAALNNAIRRVVMDTTKTDEEKFGLLLSISSSQAVHADAVASLFMRYGGIKYNPETYKYEAVDNEANLVNIVKGIDTVAAKYKMTKEEAERVAHTAFEAKRVRSLVEFNEDIDNQIRSIKKRIRDARADGNQDGVELGQKQLRAAVKKKKFIHMTDTEIADGLRLFEMMPELNDVVNTWNAMRANTVDELVDSGLWSEDEAEILLSNMDYVPFYREDQIEQGRGPKEYVRRLQVQAKEKRLKGSLLPVNDIFDNMARWTQYAIKRSVMNRLALAKIDAALEFDMAKQVKEAGKNTVRVWRDGQAEYYVLDDPMFMEAFAGLESVSIPTWKFAAKIANMLRQSVVLYPMFSLAQVPQDAFAAMFTSGLKPRFALTIPARAVKEFIKTLTKSSQTHKQLERIGAVGIRDFSAAVARNDAEVTAGLKGPPGFAGKAKDFLEHFSMASDNAVRQAVYEAAMSQANARAKAGGKPVSAMDQAQAFEKAFQLINFKARGSSKMLSMMGQVIPFFNAYLAAQHVALKTVSGAGISPQIRSDGLKILGYTTAAVMALSLIYSMAMDDDDDYINKPSVMRDRLFIVPGTGMSIPIRTDIFAIPKILTEHLYMLMTNQGATDGRKFRDSMKAALGNAFLSPTPVPQALKPIVEVGINYSFFQGRPLIGTYQKGLDVERQFNDSTSELAKVLGQTGMISPIAADHLIRGMFGSVGGLVLYMTNPLIDTFQGVERPQMSVRDMIATLPGTSAFVSKESETGLKNDFYVLRDEVSRAVNTLNDMKSRSPQEIEKFLSKEENTKLLAMQGVVNQITQQLTNIRRQISMISNLPSSQMSPSEKQRVIKELRDTEEKMLKSVDVKQLRSIAGL